MSAHEGPEVPNLIVALRAFADGLEGVFPEEGQDAPRVISSHLGQLTALLGEAKDENANAWWLSLTPDQRIVLWERHAE